ncbi:MAG: addiction module antidote protein, HigA family [Rhodospirillales bacterium]|nr:addiction module antidote protein, HigA family [Rhodospirillales bacterium]
MKASARKRDFAPVHPGEILRREFLDDLDLSVYALAKAICVPRTRLNDIMRGRRGISADTALRLARYFGTDAQSWINLQTRYDLEMTALELGDRLHKEVTPRAA